jgi:hypothetical protein
MTPLNVCRDALGLPWGPVRFIARKQSARFNGALNTVVAHGTAAARMR